MEEKTSIKEFKKFCNDYLEKDCENKIIQFTVLTGYNIGGASKSRGEEYYSAIIKCIAFVNEENDLVEKDIKFTYFLNNTKPLKFIKTQNLSVYRIACKKIKDKNLYYLIKIKKVNDKRFDKIIEEYLKPITVNIDGITFTFDRRFSQYEGKFAVQDKKVDISLRPERNSIEATKSIETFKKINTDFISFYENVLKKCSSEIVGLANDWKSDDDKHTITENEIMKRIDKNNISIEISYNDFTIYFEDDDLFLGHSIVYYGDIDSDEFSVDIAG